MTAVVYDIPQVPQASAFSNGKHQVITNASVLNANGPITIYGAPESNVPQAIPESSFLHRLLAATLHFFTSDAQDTARRELPQIEAVPDTDVNSDEDYTSSELVRSCDSNVTCVNMTPSYNKAFIPLEALSRGPSSCKTYITHMFPLGLGYPIWLPQPDRNLPVQYRRKGISIGDVGVITSDGGFDFLFNIWASAQDPVHPDGLPDDFDSMPRSKQRTSYQSLFPSGSKVSSLDIESDIGVNTKDISYTCKNGHKGAILSLPQGASQETLRNEWDLKKFIAKNAIMWYKYALLSCGRDVDRHSLYVVTGCIKSRTWGIATFDAEAQECHNSLVIGESHNTNDPFYIWKKSGGATTFRSGPSPDPGFIRESGIQFEIENQDLFLRGFKVSLSEESWSSIQEPVGLAVDGKTAEKPFRPDQPYEPRSGGQSCDDGSFSGAHPSSFTNICHNISISNFPATGNPPHPLNAINDMLLSKIPEARIAITHDNFWCEVSNQGGCGVIRLQESIEDRYVVNYCNETWACTLEPRVDHPAFDESEQVDILSPNLRELALDDVPPSSLFMPPPLPMSSPLFTDVEKETWKRPINRDGLSVPTNHHSISTNFIKSHTAHNATGTKYQYRRQQSSHGSLLLEDQIMAELLENSPQAVLEAGHLPVPDLLSDQDITMISQNDIIIALMGPSGVGKSSFINAVLGCKVAIVGETLGSCTQTVRAHGCLHPDGSRRKVIMVDTPGFDDGDRTDYDVFRDIVDWLTATYKRDVVLTGIIQLHSIAEARMRGTPGIEIFRQLCGNDALKNVILATTYWDMTPPDIATMRESQLKTAFWGQMLEQGCRMDRFYPPTMDRAWKLISQLDDRTRRPALTVHTEIVAQGKKLHQMSAFGALVQWRDKGLEGLRGRFRRDPNKQPSGKELSRAEEEMKKLITRNIEAEPLRMPIKAESKIRSICPNGLWPKMSESDPAQ